MAGTVLKASGIIKQKFKTKPGNGPKGPYNKTDFVLLFADGTEKTLTIFDTLSNDLMRGQTVEFDYVVNGKYNTVQGKIVETGQAATTAQAAAVPTPAATASPVADSPAAPATAPKRTYTRKTEAPASASPALAESVPASTLGASGREGCRSEAEASVKINLESALGIAKAVGFGNAPLADIVALADMVGRTQTAIFMDSKKDSRMNNFRK